MPLTRGQQQGWLLAGRASNQGHISQGLPLVLAGSDAGLLGGGQFPEYDLSLPPKGRPFPVALRTFVVNGTGVIGADIIYGNSGEAPVYDLSLPPRGRKPVAQSWLVNGTTYIGQDAIYGAAGEAPTYDWIVPKGRKPVALSWLQNGTGYIGQDAGLLGGGQFPEYDLSLPPKGRPHPINLRSFNLNGTGYIGQDAGLLGNGQFPEYDLSLPRRNPPRVLQDFILSSNNNLYVVVAAAPFSPALPDNPHGQLFPVALRTFTANGTGILASSVFSGWGKYTIRVNHQIYYVTVIHPR